MYGEIRWEVDKVYLFITVFSFSTPQPGDTQMADILTSQAYQDEMYTPGGGTPQPSHPQDPQYGGYPQGYSPHDNSGYGYGQPPPQQGGHAWFDTDL